LVNTFKFVKVDKRRSSIWLVPAHLSPFPVVVKLQNPARILSAQFHAVAYSWGIGRWLRHWAFLSSSQECEIFRRVSATEGGKPRRNLCRLKSNGVEGVNAVALAVFLAQPLRS
jgi:hypothetical protein